MSLEQLIPRRTFAPPVLEVAAPSAWCPTHACAPVWVTPPEGQVRRQHPGSAAGASGKCATQPAPVVFSVTPNTATPDTLVEVSGQNFSPIPNGNTVFFGAVAGAVTAATETNLTVRVPQGATHAPVQVPKRYIEKYVAVFEKGWDRIREDRFKRQLELGIIPADTVIFCIGDRVDEELGLPVRWNEFVKNPEPRFPVFGPWWRSPRMMASTGRRGGTAGSRT